MGNTFLDEVEKNTDGFKNFDPDFINANPRLLPILQHLSGAFSKASLKKQVGSVSDTQVSRPAAKRLADLLTKSKFTPATIDKGQIL